MAQCGSYTTTTRQASVHVVGKEGEQNDVHAISHSIPMAMLPLRSMGRRRHIRKVIRLRSLRYCTDCRGIRRSRA